MDDGLIDALRLTGNGTRCCVPREGELAGGAVAGSRSGPRAGVAVLYDARLEGWPLLVVAGLAATVGIASAGATYGLLAARLRQGSVLLPLLLLPLLAPVLIAATRAYDVALGRETGGGWSWTALLGVFAAAYLGLGTALYGPIMDDQ
ncbi:MAG: heme exporter protein CcmB [Microthrixaceae bacterium]